MKTKLLIMMFTRRFEEYEMDKELREKLRKEKNGIFLWMLDGAIDLIKNKSFVETEELVREKNIFFKTINPVLLYGEERCVFGPDFFVQKAQLHQDYQEWCKETLHKPLGRTNFYLQMETHFQLQERRREVMIEGVERKPNCFVGVGLKDNLYG